MDFDPNDRHVDRIRRLEFWESLRHWMTEQGYFLYKLVDVGDNKYEYAMPTREYPDEPTIKFNNIPQDPFPYAFMGPGDLSKTIQPTMRPPYSTMDTLEGRIMYAQDDKGRHLVIKMVKGGSDEYDVLRRLKDQPRLQDPQSFPSILPIIDLLPYNGHWILVMPRWEPSYDHDCFFPTYRIAMQHIVSLLEGLALLHELRIFHRDIYSRNILVNHFSSLPTGILHYTIIRENIKSHGVLRYAITDFDLAMVLDEETYGVNPRLPIQKVMIGSGAAPYEVAHAHIDFDPFKYDVACLGIYFTYLFQRIIADVPLLAPLFDRMTASNSDRRFTASEALAFAQSILSTASSLGDIPKDRVDWRYEYYELDLWAGLPQSFVKEWGLHRDNVRSWTMRLQNWLFYDIVWGWYIMYYSRYTLRVLTCVPRSIMRPLLSPFTFLFRRP